MYNKNLCFKQTNNNQPKSDLYTNVKLVVTS